MRNTYIYLQILILVTDDPEPRNTKSYEILESLKSCGGIEVHVFLLKVEKVYK